MLRNPEGFLSKNIQRTALTSAIFLFTGCLNTLHLKNIPAFTDTAPQNSTGRENLPAFVNIEIPFANTGTHQTLAPVNLHVGQGLKITLTGEELEPIYGSDMASLKLVRDVNDFKWEELSIETWDGKEHLNLSGEYLYSWHKIQQSLEKINDIWEFRIVLRICIGAYYSEYVVPVYLQNYLDWEK